MLRYKKSFLELCPHSKKTDEDLVKLVYNSNNRYNLDGQNFIESRQYITSENVLMITEILHCKKCRKNKEKNRKIKY